MQNDGNDVVKKLALAMHSGDVYTRNSIIVNSESLSNFQRRCRHILRLHK